MKNIKKKTSVDQMIQAFHENAKRFVTKTEFHDTMQKLLENDQRILEKQYFIIMKLIKMEQEQIFGTHRVITLRPVLRLLKSISGRKEKKYSIFINTF